MYLSYFNDILKPSDNYFEVVIYQIYNTLKNLYNGNDTYSVFDKYKKFYPNLLNSFSDWLNNFSTLSDRNKLKNKILFDMSIPENYYFAIICYISGMTDKFAIDTYNEIIGF